MPSIISTGSDSFSLLGYFASYLHDLAALISHIKTLSYEIINVSVQVVYLPEVDAELTSVMNSCNRNFEDLKKIYAVLKGFVRGKRNTENERVSRYRLSRESLRFNEGIHYKSRYKSVNMSRRVRNATTDKNGILRPDSRFKFSDVNFYERIISMYGIRLEQHFADMERYHSHGESKTSSYSPKKRMSIYGVWDEIPYEGSHDRIRQYGNSSYVTHQVGDNCRMHVANKVCFELIRNIRRELNPGQEDLGVTEREEENYGDGNSNAGQAVR